MHILVNGLSIGSGGGYSVGRGLLRSLAAVRPDWEVTLALVTGHPLHEPLRDEPLPANARLMFAPAEAAGLRSRRAYENGELVDWAVRRRVGAVLQLNGMLIRRMPVPTLSHFQDPWPYQPPAWGGVKDRAVAAVKRRAHATALRRAAYAGFTSGYLRDLVCGRHGFRPARSAVFYNGLPDEWLALARAGAPDVPRWEQRPPEIVSVSNINRFKRQDLVIRAMPSLLRHPGLERLVYRIVGQCFPPAYEAELRQLASQLGVAERVVFEGRVPDGRVRQVFGRARAFVLMSVCESFGIPAVEAMSCGTPVVTSDCCAMPEVCGGAADLCPVDRVDELAARLARVLTDPSHAAGLRARGFERAGGFAWSRTAGTVAGALEEIAGPAASADVSRPLPVPAHATSPDTYAG